MILVYFTRKVTIEKWKQIYILLCKTIVNLSVLLLLYKILKIYYFLLSPYNLLLTQ